MFHFADVSLPDAQDYSNFIGRARHSTPGRDGLPYVAYKGCQDFAGEVLADVGEFLAAQDVPHCPSELHDFLTEFNGQNVAFAPKGIEATDKVEPVRAPPNLRTLFLSNTDNKSLAGGINVKIIDPVLQITLARGDFARDANLRLISLSSTLFPDSSTKYQTSILLPLLVTAL